MTYYSGFVAAVPTANKETYTKHAKDAWPIFKKYGALRMVETWGDFVPKGEQTDFYRATECKDDETVVFAWVEWPDGETAHNAFESMGKDMAEQDIDEFPFDGKRMIYGGFTPIVDES